MKKVLSLVLAFAMILGSFGFVFASDFSDVKDTEYYSEPVNVLSGLGVIAGFPDGTFKPGDNVTRAQMATMITAALGIPVKGSGATGFSDVPASHWASGYIAYAVSVGFVAGYPDKTFKPENPVSYNEALTMIVASLGYTAETLPGVWPGAFVNKARGLGILDICATTGNAPAPRQDIACFLYKALTANIGYVDKDGYWHANLDGNGVANDTMLTRLGANVRKGTDGKELFFVIEGTEDADINLMNYMGVYASVYENKDGDIVAIKEVKSEFIEGYLDDLKDEYKFDSTKQAAADIYKSFKNGDIDPTDVPYDKPEESVKLAVKLDGKKISEVYSMQVWQDGQSFQADEDTQDSINAKTPKINGAKFALDEDDAIDTGAFILNGVNALSEIKEDDVVTVFKGSDGTVARIDVSDKTVLGVITKINKDGDTYTIGGETYGLNAQAETTAAELKDLMKNETEATFYIDYAGDIYLADADAVTTNYAVVLDTGNAGGSWKSDGGTKMVKLFLADGTTKEFEAGGDFAKTFTDKTSSACKAGDLVKYSVDKKDKVTKVEAFTTKADVTFDKNGVGAGNALKDSTVVFNYSGDTTADHEDWTKADNYSVLKASELFDKEVKNMFSNADEGNYVAVLALGFESADDIYTFFVKDNGTSKDGRVLTALYDGEVKDFTVTTDKEIKIFTTAAAVNYKLTFDGEEVSDVAAGISADKHFDGLKKGTFSGNVYKYDNVNYSMDPDCVVYVKDGSDWSVEKASFLAKGAEYFSDIILFKSDKLYDIVIVVVK